MGKTTPTRLCRSVRTVLVSSFEGKDKHTSSWFNSASNFTRGGALDVQVWPTGGLFPDTQRSGQNPHFGHPGGPSWHKKCLNNPRCGTKSGGCHTVLHQVLAQTRAVDHTKTTEEQHDIQSPRLATEGKQRHLRVEVRSVERVEFLGARGDERSWMTRVRSSLQDPCTRVPKELELDHLPDVLRVVGRALKT